MLRQRVHSRQPPLRIVGRLLVGLLALALVWYGAMTALLAVKVSPSTVNSLSAYRTIYDYFAGLSPSDVDGTTRALVAAAGLLAFLLLGYLAFKEFPRPYLARHDVDLAADDRGRVTIAARAIERVAETAAQNTPGIANATSRYGEEALAVDVTLRHARDPAGTLRRAHQDVRDALERHGLPAAPVRLTLTRYDSKARRELS